MRGEHRLAVAATHLWRGSSPHARGARQAEHRLRGGRRIIPACAGSTGNVRRLLVDNEDHPRMRGEHVAGHRRDPSVAGSSPHARGARPRGDPLRAAQGIIPACAGSTVLLLGLNLRSGDHPRMRGEHNSLMLFSMASMGSSPHARGARRTRAACSCSRRIIPACAGSTFWPTNQRAAPEDHPRMRGEHSLIPKA